MKDFDDKKQALSVAAKTEATMSHRCGNKAGFHNREKHSRSDIKLSTTTKEALTDPSAFRRACKQKHATSPDKFQKIE